jgi:hypothetical protein
MVQVWLKHHNGGMVAFGPTVQDLRDARTVVKVLDWLLAIKSLPFTADFYSRNTEVEVSDLNSGQRWAYVDGDPSGASDGIWDRM